MVKIHQLQYFVSSVKAGSISKASQILYISQPALSKQLSILENQLNCVLINRSAAGIELTEAGKHFYSKIEPILDDLDHLVAEMGQFSKETTIRIGSIPNIGSYLLPPIINELTKDHKIELVFKDSTRELIELLESDEIHFVFAQDAPASNHFIKELLFQEPYDAIVPTSSPLAKQQEITLNEFLNEELILYRQPCDERAYLENYCRTNNVNYSISVELSSSESMLPFVESGLGVSIIPRKAGLNIEGISSLTAIKILENGKLMRSVELLYKPAKKKLAKDLLKIYREFNGDRCPEELIG